MTLTALEIVLGIDNVIFLSVVVSRIPQAQAKRARQIGLALALVFRILLLSLLVWLIGLTQAVLTVQGIAFSWRDIILIGGGLFLIAKATHEIHTEVEARDNASDDAPKAGAFFWVIVQIIVIDMVFSLDSIITAIGMAQDLQIMIAAVVIACLIMYVSSGPVATFRGGASDHQDAGAGVSGADRRRAGSGRFQISYPARLHLLRHRVFGGGRAVQRPGQTQPQKDRPLADRRRLSAPSS